MGQATRIPVPRAARNEKTHQRYDIRNKNIITVTAAATSGISQPLFRDNQILLTYGVWPLVLVACAPQ